MFKIAQRRSVGQTVDYFLHEPELSTEEKIGVWLGRGALELGLTPPQKPQAILGPDGRPARASLPSPGMVVTAPDLRRVLEGYAPASSPFYGRPLNAYVRPNRRAAWDCVVSPHKSVSVAALCTAKADPELPRLVRRAFDLARGDLFAVMEGQARRSSGHHPDVVTGTLLAAAFTHLTSRRNDPQLHAHLLLMNATRDYSPSARRSWYALEPIQFYKQARVLDAVFQRELNRRLLEVGLDSKIMKVDGLPVAVLPAVNWYVCHRNSRAHQAILSMTRDRWNRAERTPEQKRRENLLNDRYRPSKVGHLAERTGRFERAVSRAEALAIVQQVRLVHPPGPPPAVKAPTRRSVEERLRAAFVILKRGFITPGKELILAWHASLASPMIGIGPFLAAAAEFKRERDDMNPGGLEARMEQIRQDSVAEQTAWFDRMDAQRRRTCAGLDVGASPSVQPPARQVVVKNNLDSSRAATMQTLASSPASVATPPRQSAHQADNGGAAPSIDRTPPWGTFPNTNPTLSAPGPDLSSAPSPPAYLQAQATEPPARQTLAPGPPRGP